MKNNKRKIISSLLIATSIISIGINTYSHSGRTDSSGGHKDNKNKSGLGSYHYHCGGNPAHLHTNGVCPYSSQKSTTSGSSSSSSSSKSSSSNSSKSTSSNSKTTTTTTTTNTTTVPTTIAATEIRINENIESMIVGENKKITATIIPENVTDKNITWKSSDESIATISTTGEIKAKRSGTVEITASTTDGKTNTIKINIKEEEKTENRTIEKTSTANNSTDSNEVNNTINSNTENSNPIGGILTLGLLGGGSYWGYKKYKNK